jgi:hypothetical protein
MPLIESLRGSLEDSHGIAPPWVWNEFNQSTDYIVAARVRAKYWGGIVIIYRPFLRMILNNNTLQGDAHMPFEEVSPLIVSYARGCIQALVQSTQAFHDAPGAFVLSNQWGTAIA